MIKTSSEASLCFLFCVAFDWKIMTHIVPFSSVCRIRFVDVSFPMSSSIDMSISTVSARVNASAWKRSL